MRRFTRLTNTFSKKVGNLGHAVALHFMYYNFCRIHQTLRVTPAMEAGVTNTLWSLKVLQDCYKNHTNFLCGGAGFHSMIFDMVSKKLDFLGSMVDIMNKSEAKNILRDLAKYGKIAYSEHSIEQMIDRNVTTEDILYVLMWGEIKNIKQDTVRHNWKCKVVGKTIDEEKLTVIAAIYSEIETIVITVF